jgi:hypothetical protein
MAGMLAGDDGPAADVTSGRRLPGWSKRLLTSIK